MNKTLPAPTSQRFTTLVAGLIVAAGMTSTIAAADATPLPVLMVIANQDFYYREYAEVRAALQAKGLKVVVAAGTAGFAQPQDVGTGSGPAVRLDRTVGEVDASDYSAIVFVGGWGSSMYQYAFNEPYHHAVYRPQPAIAGRVNGLINDFLESDKPVSAICHGVTVLAWARVDGVSPLRGRVVTGAAGGMPGFRMGSFDFRDAEYPARWQIEGNGALMRTSGSVGNPHTVADDVVVDGRIITAENYESAVPFAGAIARSIGNRN